MDREEMERRVNETRICSQCNQEKNVLLDFCKKRKTWCLSCYTAMNKKAKEKRYGKGDPNYRFNGLDFAK